MTASWKTIKNLGASIRERLRNAAQKMGYDFNRVLLLYMQEGFLRRLSLSQFRDSFVLKGGILFYGRLGQKTRPTKDLDFTAIKIKNDPDYLESAIKIICSISAEDGIEFDTNHIEISEIKEEADYPGWRIIITGTLDVMIQQLQIDFGFGDAVKPDSILFEYPVLLEENPIELRAYSWETVISEKFEAIVTRGEANSRMKDFYDIYFLSRSLSFNGDLLSSAIEETFRNRRAGLNNCRAIFMSSFMDDTMRKQMWMAFQKKMRFSERLDFADAVRGIEIFLSPVINALVQHKKFMMIWDNVYSAWRQA